MKKLTVSFPIAELSTRNLIDSPPEFRQNKKRSKRRIPPQTPPPPLATSEYKKELAEVLRNPFPRKLFPQNFVRFVSDFLIGITFKKGSNFVQ